ELPPRHTRALRREVLHFGGVGRARTPGVEPGDRADSRSAVEQRLPRRPGVLSHGRHRAHSGYDNAFGKHHSSVNVWSVRPTLSFKPTNRCRSSIRPASSTTSAFTGSFSARSTQIDTRLAPFTPNKSTRGTLSPEPPRASAIASTSNLATRAPSSVSSTG